MVSLVVLSWRVLTSRSRYEPWRVMPNMRKLNFTSCWCYPEGMPLASPTTLSLEIFCCWWEHQQRRKKVTFPGQIPYFVTQKKHQFNGILRFRSIFKGFAFSKLLFACAKTLIISAKLPITFAKTLIISAKFPITYAKTLIISAKTLNKMINVISLL